MYMAIQFNDKKEPYVKQVKDEGDVIREKKKWEERGYIVRQVATTNSGTGFIFLAEQKKQRDKYIWE